MSNRSLQFVLMLLLLSPFGAQAQNIPYLDGSQYSETVHNGPPTVVFFRASWCGPCNSMIGSLESLAARYQGRVRFLQVDVEDNYGLQRQLGFREVPHLLFYKNGQLWTQLTGAHSIDRIEGQLQSILQ
ncbi:thioredoxin family protein [Wenzhouxiangella marina]|uniref:Uncharacterized protein n=1 Tax=Wenzhouxiangella marina TaxID=1579979 RepID=A0A0K0XZK4_9GAMM|nr:thioredoxin family protein [Wenzhouxiangella marina]AKS43051.1 hypothetical protein WM2015_2693 [Wenzhouxiangella marina]MBB6087265.1 thioredoxin 1 [Wenzhouxiangella marina]